MVSWFGYRLAIYAGITFSVGVIFLVGAAFYSYVWPAPPPYHPVAAPMPPSTQQLLPAAPPTTPDQTTQGVPIARGNSDSVPAFGEIANLVVGTQILDVNNVLVGRVVRINTDARGRREIVVDMLGPFAGLLTIPADEIRWTYGKDHSATRGTSTFSVVDVRRNAEAAMASQPAGAREPVQVSVPSSINSQPFSVTVTPTSPSTLLNK